MFKAKTWEDIKMLSEKNKFMSEAMQALYEANEEEIIRQQCEAREDALMYERRDKQMIKELTEENENYKKENENYKTENEELKRQIAELQKNDRMKS